MNIDLLVVVQYDDTCQPPIFLTNFSEFKIYDVFDAVCIYFIKQFLIDQLKINKGKIME